MKNKNKKFIKLLLSATLIAGVLIGCSSSGEDDSMSASNDTLRVGMDLKYPPFSYIDDNGDITGFEPIIAEAFGDYMGMEVEIVNTNFSMLIPALDTGDVDILIADMSKNDERAEKADFSNPYRYTYTLALVNKEFAEANNITDDMPEEEFFNLTDKFVGVSGTMGVYYPQKYGIAVSEISEVGTGLIEVSTGLSDVLVASNEIHGFHAADKDNTVVYGGIKDQIGSNFVVKKGNTELLEKSNEFIATMYEDGGLYDQIRDEYDVIVAEFLQNNNLGLDYITMPVE